jgi:hypothetical protein
MIDMKFLLASCIVLSLTACSGNASTSASKTDNDSNGNGKKENITNAPQAAKLDTARYDQLMQHLANGDTTGRWPVKNSPYPNQAPLFL